MQVSGYHKSAYGCFAQLNGTWKPSHKYKFKAQFWLEQSFADSNGIEVVLTAKKCCLCPIFKGRIKRNKYMMGMSDVLLSYCCMTKTGMSLSLNADLCDPSLYALLSDDKTRQSGAFHLIRLCLATNETALIGTRMKMGLTANKARAMKTWTRLRLLADEGIFIKTLEAECKILTSICFMWKQMGVHMCR